MDIRSRSARRGVTLALAVVVGAGLAGCSSSTGDSAAPSSGAAATPSAGPGGGRGIDPALRQKIQACLQAAGLPVPSAGARPTGEPSAGGQGGGTPPTGGPPSGTGGRVRGLGGVLANPQDRAALAACGITLPTRAPGAGSPPTA